MHEGIIRLKKIVTFLECKSKIDIRNSVIVTFWKKIERFLDISLGISLFFVCTNLTLPTGALDSKSARMLLESFQYMNQKLGATILMVTHDAFTASYADRILFIKDGKLFNELHRGEDSRKEFFNRIIEVVTLLGGELNDVI